MSLPTDDRFELRQIYEEELQYLQELGSEFAQAHPKIAGRLAWDNKGVEVADPYVERLRESFAFMSARIRLKLAAEFPRFTQHLLEMILPGALSPVPSMAVVRLDPEPSEGTLSDGVLVRRGTALRKALGRGQQTPCEFRTGHDVTLWPIEVAEAEYRRLSGSVAGTTLPALPEILSNEIRAALRVRLRTTTGVRFDQLPLDRLMLHLPAARPNCFRLHEQITASTARIVVTSRAVSGDSRVNLLGARSLRPMGFSDSEAMLPVSPRGLSAFRVIQEYSVFPARFLFFEISDFAPAIRATSAKELDVWLLLRRSDAGLVGSVTADDLTLHCTTAINLFPHRADRILLNDRQHEYHVVADRMRPQDFEIAAVTSVTGYGESDPRPTAFKPLYGISDQSGSRAGAYFTIQRQPRLLSEREELVGARSDYKGTEVFLSIVDGQEAPYSSNLRQLAVEILCTNRDLPLLKPEREGRSDFSIVDGAPVRSVRILSGPTPPRLPLPEVEARWKLVGQLAEHHLGWIGADGRTGAATLARLLELHSADEQESSVRQREGIESVTRRPIVRRLTHGSATTWVRGHEVTVTLSDAAYAGGSAYLMAGVLEQLLARHVSINSFVETVARTVERGEIARWPARSGERRLW